MIMSTTGPRETHDYRDYNLWVPGTPNRKNRILREEQKGKKKVQSAPSKLPHIIGGDWLIVDGEDRLVVLKKDGVRGDQPGSGRWGPLIVAIPFCPQAVQFDAAAAFGLVPGGEQAAVKSAKRHRVAL